MGSGRGLLAALVLGLLLVPFAWPVQAQDAFVPRLTGRVFADGRPVNWLLEVRLESQSSSFITAAYTMGTSEFEFQGLTLSLGEYYVLVIREPGYEELRFEIRPGDFTAEPAAPGVYAYSGVIALDLESVPEADELDPSVEPRAVDLRQLVAEIPDDARDLFDRAEDALEDGNLDDGIAHLEAAILLAPDYYDALNTLGAEYLRADRIGEARDILLRAHDINPNDPLPLTNLGNVYFREGERLEFEAGNQTGQDRESAMTIYRLAVEALEEAVRLDPTAPSANFYLGAALYKVGELDRAEAMLLNSLGLDAGLSDVRLMLVNVYTRQQRYQEALDQLWLFLEENPDTPQRAQIEILETQILGALNP